MITASGARPKFELRDKRVCSAREPAQWAGRLLATGGSISRKLRNPNVQTVVVLSVPTREYASALVAAGWLLNHVHAVPMNALTALELVEPGTPVRLVSGSKVVADRFNGSEVVDDQLRIRVAGRAWPAASVQWVLPDSRLREDQYGDFAIPTAGAVAKLAGKLTSWAPAHCSADSIVTIVGPKSEIESELETEIGLGGGSEAFNSLNQLVRPKVAHCGLWWSSIFTGQTPEPPEIPSESELVILDGASAVRWLNTIESKAVVCILDRSRDTAGTSSAEYSVVQARAGGRPIDPALLGLSSMEGIETMAFEVRL